MQQEDKLKEYRQTVLAKINEKTKIKEQKRLEKRLKEKEQFAKESLEIDNKEIARLKKKFPNEELATSYSGYVLPLLKSSGIAQQRIYEKFNERFPTREAYRKKQKSKWYEQMRKAGIKRKKRTYHVMPKDLSVHTHDKCRVPVWPLLTKRSLNGKK